MTFEVRRSGDDRAVRRGDLPAELPVSTVAPAPLDVQAIRKHFVFPRLGPDRHQQRGQHAAAARAARALPTAGAEYENVHRGQSSASQHTTGCSRRLRHIARFVGAPEPAQHRRRPQHHRGPQRRHVLAAHRVPRRRQRRHDDDGAQLELRALVRDVPGDPAEVRPSGASCRLARFDPRTGELDLDHLASLIDARTKLVCCTGASNFLGTKNPLARDPRAGRRERLRAAQRRAPLAAAGRRCATGARARSSTCRRSTSTTCRSRFTRCWRRSASACSYAKEHLLGGVAAVPLRRRHDRRGAGVPGPRRLQRRCRGSSRPARRTSSARSSRRRRCASCSTSALTPTERATSAATSRSSARDVECGDGPRRRLEPAAHRAGARRGSATIPGITIYGPRDPARRSALVAFNVARPRPDGAGRGAERGRASSPAPAATARRSRTTRSGSTRRRAAG